MTRFNRMTRHNRMIRHNGFEMAESPGLWMVHGNEKPDDPVQPGDSVRPDDPVQTTGHTPLRGELRGTLLLDEPLARHTSWRVGGLADRYYRPADIEDLSRFLQQVPDGEPLLWLGLGSNLLVRDGGIRGTVIVTSGLLNGLELTADGCIRAEAGVSCAKVARFSVQHSLTGSEFLAGIPGTMGGALAMNAGAHGGETWDLVTAVETLDRTGRRHSRCPGDYDIGYRRVQRSQVGADHPEEWFVAALLRLKPGSSRQSRELIKKLLERRNRAQPTQHACAGSVFRNPPGDYAARLIDSAGLKGTCVGGACVSHRHANFIINTGTATAVDIEALIERVAETVMRIHGVELHLEVHMVGESSR